MANRRDSGGSTWISIVVSVILVALAAFLLWQVFSLQVLPPVWFVPIFLVVTTGVLLLVYFSTAKRTIKSTRTLLSVLSACLAVVFAFGSYYLLSTNNFLGMLTQRENSMNTVVEVYVLNEAPYSSVSDLAGSTIGYTTADSSDAVSECLDQLEEEGVHIESRQFKDYQTLAQALVDGEIQALVINAAYLPHITDLENFHNFSQIARVLYTYTKTSSMDVAANPVSNITSEPFTVLISGSDSREGLADNDRSDVNMLATINPITKTVLFTGIPRDAYVPVVCDTSQFACQYGEYDKLTHSGMFTYDTTKQTIENFLGVDINYVFRANFTAVVNMVDALGGIDVYVEPGYAVDYFYTNDYFGTDYGVDEGWNHLNGQAALCYAREREAYLEGDFQRIRNQQNVLRAILDKALSLNGLANFTNLLNVINGNFWTDISQDEIMSLLRFQISDSPDWQFVSYYLSGDPETVYCAESYGYASAIVLDRSTVDFAHDLIEETLDGTSAATLESEIEGYNLAADYSLDYTVGEAQASTYQQRANTSSRSSSQSSSNSSSSSRSSVINSQPSLDPSYSYDSGYDYDVNSGYYAQTPSYSPPVYDSYAGSGYGYETAPAQDGSQDYAQTPSESEPSSSGPNQFIPDVSTPAQDSSSADYSEPAGQISDNPYNELIG